MSSGRLEDLVQVSSEREIADKIELEKFVELFKLGSKRKLPL